MRANSSGKQTGATTMNLGRHKIKPRTKDKDKDKGKKTNTDGW